METIVEEQIQKETKQEKINQVFSNGYKFINLAGRKDEAQSIAQFDQQRIEGQSSIEQLTLKNNVNEFQSSSYLQDKKRQIFKKYSGRTPKMNHQKFLTNFNNLMQKTQSLKNQLQVDEDIFNKPRSQEQIGNRKTKERTISNSILRSKYSNLYELTLQNSKNCTSLQQQKLSSQNKSHISRKVKIDDYRKLQNILRQKQKRLSFFNSKEDKNNVIKNQIRQRQLIVGTVTYILFIVVFVCMKITIDNYFKPTNFFQLFLSFSGFSFYFFFNSFMAYKKIVYTYSFRFYNMLQNYTQIGTLTKQIFLILFNSDNSKYNIQNVLKRSYKAFKLSKLCQIFIQNIKQLNYQILQFKLENNQQNGFVTNKQKIPLSRNQQFNLLQKQNFNLANRRKIIYEKNQKIILRQEDFKEQQITTRMLMIFQLAYHLKRNKNNLIIFYLKEFFIYFWVRTLNNISINSIFYIYRYLNLYLFSFQKFNQLSGIKSSESKYNLFARENLKRRQFFQNIVVLRQLKNNFSIILNIQLQSFIISKFHCLKIIALQKNDVNEVFNQIQKLNI